MTHKSSKAIAFIVRWLQQHTKEHNNKPSLTWSKEALVHGCSKLERKTATFTSPNISILFLVADRIAVEARLSGNNSKC